MCRKPSVFLPSRNPEQSHGRCSHGGCSGCISSGLPSHPASLGSRVRLGAQQPHRFGHSASSIFKFICFFQFSFMDCKAWKCVLFLLHSGQQCKINLIDFFFFFFCHISPTIVKYVGHSHLECSLLKVTDIDCSWGLILSFPSLHYSLLQYFLLRSCDSQLGSWIDSAPPFLPRHQHHGVSKHKPSLEITAFIGYFTFLPICGSSSHVCVMIRFSGFWQISLTRKGNTVCSWPILDCYLPSVQHWKWLTERSWTSVWMSCSCW